MPHEGSEELDAVPEATFDKINSLLAQRLGAKLGRRFQEADKLRDQLKALGVHLYDKTRQWSYKELVKPDFGPLGHDYTRAADDKAELDEEVPHRYLLLPAVTTYGCTDGYLAELDEDVSRRYLLLLAITYCRYRHKRRS